jgi:hypothetical protein
MKTAAHLLAIALIILLAAWLVFGIRPGQLQVQVALDTNSAAAVGPLKIMIYQRAQVAAFASNRLAFIAQESELLQSARRGAQLKLSQARRAIEDAATPNASPSPASLVEASNAIRNIEAQLTQLGRINHYTALLPNAPLLTLTVDAGHPLTIALPRQKDYAIYAAPAKPVANPPFLPVWFLYVNDTDFRHGLVLSYHNLLTNHYEGSVFPKVSP